MKETINNPVQDCNIKPKGFLTTERKALKPAQGGWIDDKFTFIANTINLGSREFADHR